MANVIIVLILVAAVGYGIYSFIHHQRHGGALSLNAFQMFKKRAP